MHGHASGGKPASHDRNPAADVISACSHTRRWIESSLSSLSFLRECFPPIRTQRYRTGIPKKERINKKKTPAPSGACVSRRGTRCGAPPVVPARESRGDFHRLLFGQPSTSEHICMKLKTSSFFSLLRGVLMRQVPFLSLSFFCLPLGESLPSATTCVLKLNNHRPPASLRPGVETRRTGIWI